MSSTTVQVKKCVICSALTELFKNQELKSPVPCDLRVCLLLFFWMLEPCCIGHVVLGHLCVHLYWIFVDLQGHFSFLIIPNIV